MARSGRNGKESVKELVTVIGAGITIVMMTRMIVTTSPMRGAIMTRMKDQTPVVGTKKNQMKTMA